MRTQDHHFYQLESLDGSTLQSVTFARVGKDGEISENGITAKELFSVLIDHIAHPSASRALKGDPTLEEMAVALRWLITNKKLEAEARRKKG